MKQLHSKNTLILEKKDNNTTNMIVRNWNLKGLLNK